MNVLSNNVQSYWNGSRGEHRVKPNNARTTGSATGFTVLQGHIQLMAMVPNLPENLTSPRMKSSSRSHYTSSASQHCDNSPALPVTPRMMPSASKFRRPHLPSILAGKASQRTSYLHYPSSASCMQPPRSLSNLSLPPSNSQPITMPSFAKCLPGTKRAISHGSAIMPDQIDSRAPYFPMIPPQPQPTYQQSPIPPTLQLISKGNYNPLEQVIAQQQQQQQQQVQFPTTAYTNPMPSTTWLPPQQMGYQMVNVVEPSVPFNYTGGSGDHTMAAVIHQIQQQQTYEQEAQFVYNPYCQYQQLVGNNLFQYSQQPPYAVQSLPSFGTCAFPVSSGVATTKGLVLPTINNNTTQEVPQPVYSASMPEICLSTGSSQCAPAKSLNRDPRLNPSIFAGRKAKKDKRSGRRNDGGGKKEVAVIVEDSSSSSTSTSSLSEEENESEVITKSGRKKGSKSISVLKLREIHKEKEEKKAKQEAKYDALGPESVPDKLPSKPPRVTHTPVVIPLHHHQQQENGNKTKEGKPCSSKACKCCSQCKCCPKDKSNNVCVEEDEPKNPKSLDEKVREMRSKLTPRRKSKVVVAVHDCFPSDSSVSDPESDLDSARKSCFNYNGQNGAIVRKRKPRIDAILKTKMRGDSSEVFDDLNTDLNPDEARTYTGDYLVELLTSEDWNNCYTALQVMVRLARHRPKVLLNYLSGPILWCTFHHITSPKSALCRAAIVTFKELFQTISSALDNDLEKITEKLVLKSLAPNMFIREECDRALEAMVAHCNLVKVLNAMDIVCKKPHARAAGHRLSRMALQIVQVAGVDTCLKPQYAEKLLPMLFGFMTEANNGTRTAAKEALGMLMNHLQFENAVTRHVTFDRNCTEVFKKLDKMRGRNRCRRLTVNPRYPLPHAHFRR